MDFVVGQKATTDLENSRFVKSGTVARWGSGISSLC